MSVQPKVLLTPEAYLTIERKAEYKSEFIAGDVVARPGASRIHNLIVTNIVISLGQQLRGQPCALYSSDIRVRMPTSQLYVYPDIVVVCGEPQFDDSQLDTLLNPTLMVEVLSPSTESQDRGVQAPAYTCKGWSFQETA